MDAQIKMLEDILQIPEGDQRHVPRTPVSDLLWDLMKWRSQSNQLNPTVGTTVDILVPSNPNRISLLVINNSASPVYWGFKTDVSSTNGGILGANGGFFGWNWRDEGEFVIREIYAIAGSAGLKCTVFESVLSRGS
jgi:hypothetical protein